MIIRPPGPGAFEEIVIGPDEDEPLEAEVGARGQRDGIGIGGIVDLGQVGTHASHTGVDVFQVVERRDVAGLSVRFVGQSRVDVEVEATRHVEVVAEEQLGPGPFPRRR
jgi:hypothetical protein